MRRGVCPSVCLSVECLDLTENGKAQEVKNWYDKHIIRVTHEPIQMSKVKDQGHQADKMLSQTMQLYTHVSGNSRDAKVKVKTYSIKLVYNETVRWSEE